MRTIEVFSLVGNIFVKGDEAVKTISGVEKKAQEMGNNLSKNIKTAAKWGAGIAAGVGAGATALFGVASKSAEATDEIDKMSQKIGISKQAYQEYSYILSQNGTDVQVLQRGMRTLTQRMEESASGSGKGAEAFNALGISATDLNGNLKTQEQMFDEAAKALMQLPEGTEKSTLAFELFGRTGQELMPMLNGTAEGMEELRNEAHNMGLVLSDEAVQAGADFTDMKDNVTRALGAVVANIGVELMPMFMTMFQWIMDHMPQIQMIITTVFDAIGFVVTNVTKIFSGYLLPVFDLILNWVKLHWPAIENIIRLAMNGIEAVISTVTQVIKAIWDTWGNELVRIMKVAWDLIMNVVNTMTGLIKGIINTFIGLVTGDWTKFAGGLKKIWETMWQYIRNILKAATDLIKIAIDLFINTITKLWTNFTDGLKKIWDAAWDLIKIAVDTMTGTIEGIITAFTGLITKLWTNFTDGLKKIWSSMWNGIEKVVRGAWELLVSAFNNLYTSIEGWFVDLAKDAITWGTDMIKGLWKGISDMTSWISDKVSGFAKGVADTFKNFFGIKSPSTLMAGYGIDITEGLAQGIEEGGDRPLNAMTELGARIKKAAESAMSEVSSTISSSRSGGGGGGGGGGSSRSMSTEERFKRLSDNQDYYSKNKDAIDRISKKHNADLGESVKRHQKNDYHDGGWVGNPLKLKRDEEEAILQKGEFVLSRDMIRNAGKKSNGGIVQNITINSPNSLSPSEVARQVKNTSRRLALEV